MADHRLIRGLENINDRSASGTDLDLGNLDVTVNSISGAAGAAASFPGGIDVNGASDGIILDADGDTKISSATDDTVVFTVSSASKMQITASAVTLGSGVDLVTGASTNIQLGSSADIILAASSDIIGDVGTATASSNAAVISKSAGVITTESLSTAGLAAQDITLTNTRIAAADVVVATLAETSGADGTPVLASVTPAAGSCVFKIRNLHATEAFSSRVFKIAFQVIKSA